jgi:hypothetical protein
VAVDFSKYASTTALMQDCTNSGGPWQCFEDQGTQNISLDLSPGYGASNRSLPYTFPDRSGSSGRCGDYSISRTIEIPSTVTEVWFEVVAMFSENFVTRAPSTWNCNSNPDYKFIGGGFPHDGRMTLNVGVFGQDWEANAPGNFWTSSNGQFARRPPTWDGKWHRYRFHWKVSSTTTSGDGIVRIWIDDELVVNQTAVSMNQSGSRIRGFNRIMLGLNLNQGPGQIQKIWWGDVNSWNTNPGW